jgi:YspA, cpYpsA-related SLOG family
MRILITGGRSWSDRETIMHALLEASRGVHWSEVTVVHGGAKGADTIASELATGFGMKVEAHLADWQAYHKAAGPLRNQKMVDLGADVCLAFLQPNSKGTANCIEKAKKAGIKTIIFEEISDS